MLERSDFRMRIGRGKLRLSSGENLFIPGALISLLVLVVVPTELQVLPLGVPRISNWSNLLTLALVILLFVMLLKETFDRLKIDRRLGLTRADLAPIFLIATTFLFVVENLVRPDPSALNFLLNLVLLLAGLALVTLSRFPVFATSQSTVSLIIVFSIGANWVYQAFKGYEYGRDTDIAFAHTLALSLPFLLLVGGKGVKPSLIFLTHSTSWLAFVFLLQTQLRGPAFIAAVIVSIQSLWLASSRSTRFLACASQLGAAIMAWGMIVRRDLLDSQGNLYISGRERFTEAFYESRDFDFFSVLFGEGPGSVRRAIAAALDGYDNPHSSWMVLIGDYGLLRGGLVIAALILAATVAGMETIQKSEIKQRVWASRLMSLGALSALGLVSEPVETLPVVLVILAFFVWTPRSQMASRTKSRTSS